MNVLALDLGTHTGWAIRSGEDVFSGTWHLSDAKSIKSARAVGQDRACDGRFSELCCQIEQAVDFHDIKTIVFEDVLFSTYTFQVQLWSALRAAIWAVRRYHPIPVVPGGARVRQLNIDCTNTATLKKFATGHGNADKAQMAAYLLKRYPQLFVKNPKPTADCFLLRTTGERVDENETDARHLLDFHAHL